MAINISPKIITDGLVLCLDAKDLKSYAGSGAYWIDRSGNDNDGSINGATFNSNGYFGLDGTNDKITTGAKLSSAESGSIYLFCKPSTPPNSSAHMLCYQGTSSGRIWLYVNTSGGGTIGLNTYFGTGKDFYLSSSDVDLLDKWGLFTLTFNRSDKQKIYYNGEFLTSLDISSASSDSWSSSYLALGGFDYDGASWYTAEQEASQFLLYNAEHSLEQKQQNFNAIKGRFGL